MKKINRPFALSLLTVTLSSLFVVPQVAADDTFIEAMKSGKVSFSARARYENVNQDNALEDADAFTLRTTLGYETGRFNGFGGFLELEDVTALGAENYNSTTNGETSYSVVADPEGTEVNQAYLSYQGFDSILKFGRQQITYRDAPFHRFIGNVLWRQNQQTFDAFSIQHTGLPNTQLSYAYINKVNTIFGEDANRGIIKNGNIDLNGHFVNLQYSGLPIGKLETYGYFLDYQDAEPTSSKTLGLRLSGAQPLSDAFSVVYAAEYASQDDYKSGVMDRQDYYLAEIGGKYKGWLLKLSHEVQEGDGTFSFNTPLGTNHAFQGWADQFLTTPVQGLQDNYLTLVGNVLGAKLVAVYHDFETDQDSLDAGDEFDIMLEKTFKKHYTLGVKYADYNADEEFGGVDTEKFWVYGQVKF